MNITSPALIASLSIPSDIKGSRLAMTPASVSGESQSSPVEAPVISVILNGSSLARSASALGIALTSPARVNPLIPTTIPSWMNEAASSAFITFPKSDLHLNLSRYTL